MTEEEAKTKRCPQTMATHVDGDCNPGNCVGSACMAWRWVGLRRRTDAPDGRTIDHFDDKSAEEARAKTYHNRNVGFLGACGLAGKP